VEAAAANLVPVYAARQEESLDAALSQPLNREILEALDTAAAEMSRAHAAQAAEARE